MVGASLVKHVANATNDTARNGEIEVFLNRSLQPTFRWVNSGTTCSTLPTKAVFSEGYKSVAAGMDAMGLRRGINLPVNTVVPYLKTRAKMISTTDEIAQVGTIAANRELEIGDLIAWAMEKAGKEGVVTVPDGKNLYNKLKVAEGIKLDRGSVSPLFITNVKSPNC